MATGPVCPPPTKTADEPDRAERVIVRVAIGTGIILLLLLLLLLLCLLLFRSGDGPGQGPTADAGAGDGGGHGVGQGEADGAGDGQGAGAGGATQGPSATGGPGSSAPSDLVQADQTAGDQSNRDPAQQEPPQPVTPDPDPSHDQPPPEAAHSIQRLTARTGGARAASGGTAQGGGSGSGDMGEFFGVKARGRRFVYIVDRSGSMKGGPFLKACEELIKSLEGLNARQSFYVMFFSDDHYPMFFPDEAESSLKRATGQNVERIQEWTSTFEAGGGTNPGESLLMALRLKPEVIFLLTDGEFDAGIVHQVTRQNRGKVTINTVGFINRDGEPLLKELAGRNGGEYRFVP